MMVEGSSMRSISRVVGISVNTVVKLVKEVGQACETFHEFNVRNITAKTVECDEIWSFCYAKEGHLGRVTGNPDYAGDIWTWTGLDKDSRLIISWMVSAGRDPESAQEFMLDLQSRIANRIQLTTDGLKSYLTAVGEVFGAEIDYAQLVKIYGGNPKRYQGAEKIRISGKPNMNRASTSLMERHNLTTRMSLRRFTRDTNGHSKKVRNHCYALAIYFVWYNFCRIHTTLEKTPAMAAGLTHYPYSLEWMLDLADCWNRLHEHPVGANPE